MSTIKAVTEAIQQKLLGEYVSQYVEEETDEKVVEKYSRSGMTYTLTSEKNEGMKHGKAELVDEDKCVIAELTFDRGNITGHCVICNSKGIPQFDGFLRNGVRDGACTEFDNFNQVTFYGCYREGKKIPFFEEVGDKPGFFLEHAQDDLHAVSYTQYDLSKKRKYGQCFVLNSSGEVVQELNLDNNEEVVREFGDNVMVAYENSEVVYEGGYSGDWKGGYKRHGNGKEYENGVLIYEGEFVNDQRNVVLSECKRANFRGYFEERTMDGKLLSISQMKKKTLIKHGRSIVFSLQDESPVSEKWFEDGKVKWENVRVDGTTMTELDEGGNVIYKGEFKFLDGEFLRWGEGKEYECGNVVYKGGFQNGFYDGEGALYRDKKIYFNGNWKCGYPEGEGMLYNDDLTVNMKGNWHLGYLEGVDYMTGEKRGFCSCLSDCRKMKELDRDVCIDINGNEVRGCMKKGGLMKEKMKNGFITWLTGKWAIYEILLGIVLLVVLMIFYVNSKRHMIITNCDEFTNLNWVERYFVRELVFNENCCNTTTSSFELISKK